MPEYKDLKKYKQFIVVDENNKPMTFSRNDGQLVYCTTEDWRDQHFSLRLYSYEEALRVIRITIENRKKWKCLKKNERYKLVPVYEDKKSKGA